VLDWQILNVLLNIVAQWQVEEKLHRPLSSTSDSYSQMIINRVFREERNDDPPFDLNVLTEQRIRIQLKLGIALVLKTWGLMSYRSTPDFDAIERLLDERYAYSVDDVPHADPLSRSGTDGDTEVNVL
jgi:hypothetical protein